MGKIQCKNRTEQNANYNFTWNIIFIYLFIKRVSVVFSKLKNGVGYLITFIELENNYIRKHYILHAIAKRTNKEPYYLGKLHVLEIWKF